MNYYSMKKQDIHVLKLKSSEHLCRQLKEYLSSYHNPPETFFIDFSDVKDIKACTIVETLNIWHQFKHHEKYELFLGNMNDSVLHSFIIKGLDRKLNVSGSQRFEIWKQGKVVEIFD